MQNGDISNEISPVIIIVYEGLVGLLPDIKTRRAFDRAVNTKKWRKAAACFLHDELVTHILLDIVWRRNVRIEGVTFLPPELAEELEERMETEHIPLARLESFPAPGLFARELVHRPYVKAVYDANPEHRLLYPRGKGVIVNPGDPYVIGT
jgi:hypothetical protein